MDEDYKQERLKREQLDRFADTAILIGGTVASLLLFAFFLAIVIWAWRGALS